MKTEDIIIGACFIGIAYLLFTKNEAFQNIQPINDDLNQMKRPDDLFTDGLDHPYGLKKKNRHHSF